MEAAQCEDQIICQKVRHGCESRHNVFCPLLSQDHASSDLNLLSKLCWALIPPSDRPCDFDMCYNQLFDAIEVVL